MKYNKNMSIKRGFTLISKACERGFTLIELLVVISIIGILATLVTANLNSARQRGRDAQRKSDLRNIQTALRLYYNDKGIYPAHNSSKKIVGCGSLASPTACEWGGAWTTDTNTYMSILPKDPLSNQSYKYTASADWESYNLDSCLENKSDDKCVTDAPLCPASKCKYSVSP